MITYSSVAGELNSGRESTFVWSATEGDRHWKQQCTRISHTGHSDQ